MGTKHQPLLPKPPGWKRAHSPTGYEFYHYASPLARQAWLYVRAIGRANQFPAFRHRHRDEDGVILHFVMRGHLWHRWRERAHTTGPGEACLFDLDDVTYGNAGQERVQFYWVWFNGKDLPELCQQLRLEESPVFQGLDPSRFESIFRALMPLASQPTAVAEAQSSAYLTLLLAELLAVRPAPATLVAPAAPGRPFSEPVRRAVDWVTRTYDQDVTVKQIAGLAGLSLHHFSRQFHREVGLSPMAYLTRHRIERAKQLLVSTTRSINSIARSVGYHNASFFARMFTKVVNRSPRDYRREQTAVVGHRQQPVPDPRPGTHR